MLLNWTYLEVLVAGGLGFVTLELPAAVPAGHGHCHWSQSTQMFYLTLYEITHYIREQIRIIL